jgi:glycine cleavage system transcriptional repressor
MGDIIPRFAPGPIRRPFVMSMPEVRKYLSITALAPTRDGLSAELIAGVEQRGCEVAECRIVPLGNHFAASLLLTGNWSALGKLESALPGLADRLGLELRFAHTELPESAPDYRPYSAEVIAPQHSKLLSEILQFFAGQDVRVMEISAQAYESGFTGAPMCSIHLALQVPMTQHPQSLREAFMDLCDDLHADGMLDPIKS